MNLLSYTLDRTTVSIPHIDIKHRKYNTKAKKYVFKRFIIFLIFPQH